MSSNGETVNIFLSGVGGQGTILASNVLGMVLLDSGYDVKKAEVHGMAQRGGDVTTHFRYGKKVYSPLIREGDADFLVSFELVEALRYINWVKPEGKVILNNHKILPPGVNLGEAEYPADVPDIFREHFKENVWVVEGRDIAKELGNIQVANIVLLGALSNFFTDIKTDQWLDVIKGILPARIHDINVQAFHKGRESI
ncbi:MAG: indolepyruvate oxidoreductase subunit beta [Acidobacteriota bacterium]